MKGYKVFNSDWKCNDFQYEVGQTYELKGKLKMCANGFHFCKKLIDCFNYYDFDSGNKVAEIVALGNIVEENDKCCTDKIKIVHEISWQEALSLVNIGQNCAGKGNTGHRNSGDWNSGNQNSGHWNSGHWNSGDYNSGHWNSGNQNSGHWNSGNWNSGNQNSGHRNTGDFNTTSFSTGCFNTKQQKILFFDKKTTMTLDKWRKSNAYRIMRRVNDYPVIWVYGNDMTKKEKEQNPSWEITDGYLKKLDTAKAYKTWWKNLTAEEKQIIREIPNFDPDIFSQITGIKTEELTK